MRTIDLNIDAPVKDGHSPVQQATNMIEYVLACGINQRGVGTPQADQRQLSLVMEDIENAPGGIVALSDVRLKWVQETWEKARLPETLRGELRRLHMIVGRLIVPDEYGG